MWNIFHVAKVLRERIRPCQLACDRYPPRAWLSTPSTNTRGPRDARVLQPAAAALFSQSRRFAEAHPGERHQVAALQYLMVLSLPKPPAEQVYVALWPSSVNEPKQEKGESSCSFFRARRVSDRHRVIAGNDYFSSIPATRYTPRKIRIHPRKKLGDGTRMPLDDHSMRSRPRGRPRGDPAANTRGRLDFCLQCVPSIMLGSATDFWAPERCRCRAPHEDLH